MMRSYAAAPGLGKDSSQAVEAPSRVPGAASLPHSCRLPPCVLQAFPQNPTSASYLSVEYVRTRLVVQEHRG